MILVKNRPSKPETKTRAGLLHIPPTPILFSLEGAAEYLRESLYPIDPNEIDDFEHFLSFENMRCIDDREPRQKRTRKSARSARKKYLSTLPHYAAPGDSMGVVLTTFGARKAVEDRLGVSLGISPRKWMKCIRDGFGTPAFHVDEASQKLGNGSLHTGCGHLKCNLNGDGLPEDARDFLTNEYIPEVAEELRRRGTPPIAYRGPHLASGVFSIKSLVWGVRSGPANGSMPRAYIYHHYAHKIVVSQVASHLYFNLLIKNKLALDISPTTFRDQMFKTARITQLGNTLAYLKASELPLFYVKHEKGNLVVEDAATNRVIVLNV